MAMAQRLARAGLDFYMVLLAGTVMLAVLLPARGMAADGVKQATYLAVALLFFLYGARLDLKSILAGIANWRLQGLVFASTFLAFPLIGLAVFWLAGPLLPPEIALGLLYVSILPSTVQSSIAFTSIAGGNVAGAVCAASISNLLGVVLTPIFAALLLHSGDGQFDASVIVGIAIQILLPFALGQVARPLIGDWLAGHAALVRVVDRGSILLIVYSAFSAGMVAGIWQALAPSSLAILFGACCLMLVLIMGFALFTGRAGGLDRADRLALFFCGSKKSLASGLPMANILFAGQGVGLIVLPLMVFHQVQLFACAIIAQRAGQRRPAAAAAS